MAGKADGSITIDTKLDNAGFEAGSKELRHAVHSLEDQVNATGGKLRDAFKFDFGQPKQAANTFQAALKRVNAEITDLGELGKRAISGDVDAMRRFEEVSDETRARLDEMRAELNKFGAAKFETPEHQQIAAQYQAAATQVEELTKQLEAAEDRFDAITENFGRSAEYMNLEDRIDELRMWKAEYDEAAKRGDAGGQLRAMMGAGINKGTIDEALKQAEAEMDKMWQKFETSTPYKKTQAEIDKITEKLQAAKASAEQYKAQMDQTPESFQGYSTSEFQKDSEALERTIDRLLEYRRLVAEGGSSERAGASSSAASARVQAITLDQLQAKLNGILPISGMVKGAMSSAFDTIVSGAKRATASLAGMVKSGIMTGLNKLGNAISNLSKKSKKNNLTLGTSFKTMLRYGLGIRSTFVLFNKLRNALVSGFTNLAAYDSEMKTTINELKASLATLKNSFAAAFAPVARIVLPILTNLINALATAISHVGMLIAALTGKSSFTRATAAQADSADAATKAMDDESEAAQDLQKNLAGFDDVEILSDNKSSGSGSGKNKGAAGGGFEEVPIDSDFGNLAKMIKEAWEKADFTEIGALIGKKLKSALESIPWAQIRIVLRKIATSIATLLNGFLETPGLFTTIGKTIAEGINSAVNFVHTLIKSFHWESLGTAVKDLILGALNNINWREIYQTARDLGAGLGAAVNSALNNPEIWSAIFTTISRWLNAKIYAAIEFVKQIKWGELGQNIGKGMNKGVDEYDWGALGYLLIQSINGAFDLWYNWVTEFDFAKFGEHIGNTISQVLTGIDWEKGGMSVAETMNGLFRALSNIVSHIRWEEVADGVVKGIIGFFREFEWDTFGETLHNLLDGLLRFLRRAVEKFPWEEVPDYIAKAISDFLTGFDWEGLIDETIGLIKDALNGLIRMLAGDKDAGEESPVVSALNRLKDSIGKISSKDFKKLATAIGNLVEALAPAGEGFAAGFLDVFAGLVDIGIEFIKALGPALQDIADAINSIPPETLASMGESLGKFAAAFLVMKGASSVITNLANFIGLLKGAGVAGTAAAAGTEAAATAAGAAGAAAETAGQGVGGLAGGFATNLGATAAFTDAINNLLIPGLDGSAKKAAETDKAFGFVTSALHAAGEESGLTAGTLASVEGPMQHLAMEAAPDFATAFAQVATGFEQAGGDVDAFKLSLKNMLDEGRFSGAYAQVIQDYISDIGTEANTSETNTDNFASVFDKFSALKLSVPLKMAILSGAVKNLGEKGVTSEEQTAALQDTLDAYDANPTAENMQKVIDAFAATGISADDCNTAIMLAITELPESMQPELAEITKTVEDLGPDLKSAGTTDGENLSDGLIEGVLAKQAEAELSISTWMEDMLGTVDGAADMHSPSKEMAKRGGWLVDGMRVGVDNNKAILNTVWGQIMDRLLNTVSGFINRFQKVGEDVGEAFLGGFSAAASAAGDAAAEIGEAIYIELDGLDFWSVGYNIGIGIYNGLMSQNYNLQVLAWNTAVAMYNSACAALGIHSPSKKFAWIGEMTTAGLANGIEDSKGTALNAVTALADAVTEEATQTSPVMTIDTAAGSFTDGLDAVLAGFSDKVVSSFSAMIAAMESIVNGSSFVVPAVASGAVAPYSSRRAAEQESAASTSDILGALARRDAGHLTKDDLAEVLAAALQQYLDIDFYIGDEQIARHANAGNARLNRRYRAVAE